MKKRFKDCENGFHGRHFRKSTHEPDVSRASMNEICILFSGQKEEEEYLSEEFCADFRQNIRNLCYISAFISSNLTSEMFYYNSEPPLDGSRVWKSDITPEKRTTEGDEDLSVYKGLLAVYCIVPGLYLSHSARDHPTETTTVSTTKDRTHVHSQTGKGFVG